jgi:hypothetical protein
MGPVHEKGAKGWGTFTAALLEAVAATDPAPRRAGQRFRQLGFQAQWNGKPGYAAFSSQDG